MAKIYIRCIQSSSDGNCIVLFDGVTHLFLDFGCQNQMIDNYLIKYCVEIRKIAGCLITHEHIDHVKAIYKNKYHDIKFYSQAKTISKVKSLCPLKTIFCAVQKFDKWIKIKDTNWSFKAFSVIHNATDPICYIIKNGKNEILYLTDTEYFYNNKFKGLNGYIIEANYGSEIIFSQPKKSKHIDNNINHLKLEETELLLTQYCNRKTKIFIFSHLSHKTTNNSLITKIIKKLSTHKLVCHFFDPHKNLKEEYTIE